MDNIDYTERSRVMSLVKQKNTKPELIIRSLLHKKGFRFRLHSKELPGKPDLVMRKYKTVIFVNGCFWHGHADPCCKLARIPKSRVEFWTKKILRNIERDNENILKLTELGWQVVTIWECKIKDNNYLNNLIIDIKRNLNIFSKSSP